MEKYLVSNEKISATSDVKFSQIQPKCLRKYAWKIKSLEIKSGKAKLWRSICLVMKIFRTVSSDVVWPFKNQFCQNRINKIGQIQPKCLRKYTWKIKSLEIKPGKAKLWRSIYLVMKKISPIWRRLTLQKIICRNCSNKNSLFTFCT